MDIDKRITSLCEDAAAQKQVQDVFFFFVQAKVSKGGRWSRKTADLDKTIKSEQI